MEEKLFEYEDENFRVLINTAEVPNQPAFEASLFPVLAYDGSINGIFKHSPYEAAEALIRIVDGALASLTAVRAELQEYRRTC